MSINTPDHPDERDDISETEDLTSDDDLWHKAEQLFEDCRQSSIATRAKQKTICPMDEMTISHALGEADPENEHEILSHIDPSICPDCCDLHSCTEKAEAKSRETDTTSTEKSSVNAVASRGSQKSALNLDIIYNTLRNLSTFFYAHRTISVAAACSAFIFVATAIYYQAVNTPLTASFTMITQPPSTRSGDRPEPRQVQPGDTVFTGDRYRLLIEANGDGYGYVILAGSSGRIALLYSGPVREGEPLWIPDENEWAQLDPWTGDETLYLIVSRNLLGGVEDRLEQLEQEGTTNIGEVFEDAKTEKLRFSHER